MNVHTELQPRQTVPVQPHLVAIMEDYQEVFKGAVSHDDFIKGDMLVPLPLCSECKTGCVLHGCTDARFKYHYHVGQLKDLTGTLCVV